MVALVTLGVAKAHLRVEHKDDDTDIGLKAEQASEIVLNYIKRRGGDDGIPWTPDTVPFEIQAATLIMLEKLYDDRNAGKEDGGIAFGYPPQAVTSLCHRWRDPALA
jgi:hypothetical protein